MNAFWVCLLQTHPNVDKKLFASNGIVALKDQAKPFPVKQDIGVLKWRFQTQDDAFMPLSSTFLRPLSVCVFRDLSGGLHSYG